MGYLAGAIGVGAVVGSFLVMARSQISRPLFQMTLNLFVFGGILIAISIQDSLVVTAVLLGVSGALVTSYMALANGVLLSQSDPQMLGRVMSLMSLDRGLIPLGAILAGVLVSGIGIQPGLFTMGAVMVTLSGGVLLLFGRQISQLGEMEPRSVEERAETPSAEDMPAKDMSAGKRTPIPRMAPPWRTAAAPRTALRARRRPGQWKPRAARGSVRREEHAARE